MPAERLPYHLLMRRRISEVLLVASAYDSFILEEEGGLGDHIFREYLTLNLADAPRFTRVRTGREALAALRKQTPDLVITSGYASDMTPRRLAARIRRQHPDLPVVMLTYDPSLAQSYAPITSDGLDEVFLWTGDPRLLLGLVKLMEDRLNVAHDVAVGNVRVIIVVEDSPAFSSSFLSIIYAELLEQTQRLLADVLNEADRRYRARARPKILLAHTYEEACQLIRAYKDNLLGAIVDLRFPRDGVHDPGAGVALVQHMRQRVPDLPILLQSAEIDTVDVRALNIATADKSSPHLLGELRRFMKHYLGFGPFVFRVPSGRIVALAEDLQDMVRVLPQVPAASIRYHAERQHFSNWLMARTEFPLADELRPRRADEFDDDEALRAYLLGTMREFLDKRQRGLVTVYTRGTDPLRSRNFTRIGSGSLGGKSRGLAFMASILAAHPIHDRYPDVRISVPQTLVLCTGVFEAFCDSSDLVRRALALDDDDAVARLFLDQPLSPTLETDLAAILADVDYPLAVRSSSLLEDSVHQPLAGLYATLILSNRGDGADRLRQLSEAIRYVFASTFFRGPRAYLQAVGQRLEAERMAVVVQRLVGRSHGDRFYPDVSGTVQSENFYPVRYLQPDEGIASVCLGLGDMVVEGGAAYRFCPLHPEVVPEMSTVDDILRNSQRDFYALDLSAVPAGRSAERLSCRRRYPLRVAEADGTLEAVASTYVAADDRIRDTIHVPGARVLRFAPILKHGVFPLAPILAELVQIGAEGMAAPVEIEFAVALGDRPELAVLQIRPLVQAAEVHDESLGDVQPGERVVIDSPALGHGIFDGLSDIIIVCPRGFDRARTREIAVEVERLNARMLNEGRRYLLIGPGRWGTSDPWLGVPVSWPQVSAAQVIVELTLPDERIDPSQGTHFFHNITGLRIGYFTVDLSRDDQRFDMAWIESLPHACGEHGVRHIRLDGPLQTRIDGRRRKGVVVRKEPA